jgi:hypothetical protein
MVNAPAQLALYRIFNAIIKKSILSGLPWMMFAKDIR